MPTRDVLDQIIAQIDPEEVPSEFIVMAKVTNTEGDENFISGSDLEKIMENPEQYNIVEARIILDVHKIRKAILDKVANIFRSVHEE